MVKKIKTDQLKPGMYVHDLNCSWMDHPFLGSSLNVSDIHIIEKIMSLGIREVYIDTVKGLDVCDVLTKEECEHEEHEEDKRYKPPKENKRIRDSNGIIFENIKPVPVSNEILKAKKIREESILSVRKVMDDIKSGNQIDRETVINTVDDILISILRNKNALTGLKQLRQTDEYLYGHSINVCTLMVSFGKYLGFAPQLLREVGIGALLHDIGTMKVPSEILNRKTALTDDEYATIQRHVQYGREILEETDSVTETAIITAYHHHERLDGSGYPNGLMGDKISYTGQAIAIVDVYDSLTTKKCYRRKIPPTQALEMIYEWSERQFNRELVQKFIRCIGIYPVGSLVRLESGLIGVVIDHCEDNLLQPVVRAIYNRKTERYIPVPYVIDLSQPRGSGGSERILSYEFQEELNIQPEMYL